MARCVKCGEGAAEPVWAAYADPAFENKPPAPLLLHQECYEESADRYLPFEEATAVWGRREIERAS
jgi:hypothetical protein